MEKLSGTKIASFRGDIEDLRNGTIDRSVFSTERNKIVQEIGEKATKQLEKRLRTELTQGGDDIGDSRPAKKPARSNNKEGPMQMAKGGTANGKPHMYAAGGSVTDKLSPGLKALNKTRPDVVKKILGK
tara:strand:+ start:702 stop:1088 length:387 start_codon:yes stop_codon:yes gene_type:complete